MSLTRVRGSALPVAWELARKSYAEAGYTLRPEVENFEEGGRITSETDVLMHRATGKAYSGPIGVVPPNTNPNKAPYVDRSTALLRNDSFVSVTPDRFMEYGDDFLIKAVEYCKLNNVALHIPRGRTYNFNKRVTFDQITLMWEGTLNLTKVIDMPIVFRSKVTMPTYGYLKTDKSIVMPDDHYMVGFYATPEDSYNSYGCTDNIISGRLDIRNGHIDYEGNGQGRPDDINNLTGGGVLLLAGAWNRSTTGVTRKTYEYVHKNSLNLFVDGFSYPLVLQAMLDKDNPDSDLSTVWVNGNEINIKARRAKDYLRILSPLARPNGRIGGEVAGNVIQAEFQRSTGLTKRWLYCQGRGNKITMKGWDPTPDDGIMLAFERGNNLAEGVAEPAGNIIEMLQATLAGIGESEFSDYVYEQVPGLNTFISPSKRYANIIPEEAPFSNAARQTASYTGKLDNFLAGIHVNPRNTVKVYKNGVLQSPADVGNMFDLSAESSMKMTVSQGDYVEVVISLKVKTNHFNYIGQTLGYLTNGLGGRVVIELKDTNGDVKYTLSQNLRPTNVSGYIDVTNIQHIRVLYRDFRSSGSLNISSIFGKVYNKPTNSGMVTMHGCSNVVGDIAFEDVSKGVILKDRATGQRWRLYMNNGNIAFEAYNP